MTSTSSSAQKTEQLLRQTRRHFPRFDEAEVAIEPIEKGGSGRRFYRVRSGPEQSLILVKYNLEREENRHYVQIAHFLAAHGIRAPRVYFHDPMEGLIWIEDLGEADLWSFREESWPTRRRYYESALAEVTKLHALPASAAAEIEQEMPPAFDEALYLWEQNYFFDFCLGRYFGVEEKTRAQLAALPTLAGIAQRLARLPRVLVHRDFQSQNIILREGAAHLIDFQGMRPGLAQYDVASLLYDPYVSLGETERTELFALYGRQRAQAGQPLRDEDAELLRCCALQRLMQALGAYGNLGLVQGNAAFLAHIAPAFRSLRGLVREIDGLAPLDDVLQQCALPAE